jgi:hypothetical protein
MTTQVYLFFAAIFGLAAGQSLFNEGSGDESTRCFGGELRAND